MVVTHQKVGLKNFERSVTTDEPKKETTLKRRRLDSDT